LKVSIRVDELISPRFLHPMYQPIVDLKSRATVGFEALARWPELHIDPEQAFAVAASDADVNILDWACQAQAFRGALVAGLGPSTTLFVNAEPSSFARPAPEILTEVSASAARSLRVVVEITERALLKAPAELLRTVREIRQRGWGIALDDVGAVPESLALLPFVAPDVIKLDLGLIQRTPDPDQTQIMAAVMAYVERTGATIVAEGIETAAHLDQAVALGATLGQGWYFGAPGARLTMATQGRPVKFLGAPEPPPRTPFAGVDPARTRIGRKSLLVTVSRHLERQGMTLVPPPVLLSSFQHANQFHLPTQARYARLAARCPLVAVLGEGLGEEPAPGVRGTTLSQDDPLRGEWTVAVVGAHYAGALLARDLGDSGPDRRRRFAFDVTHDPTRVLAAAQSMLERVAMA
jgi:EAL domain-containing protein (putative c-di-GMP-specific phosphodiesterase class I)